MEKEKAGQGEQRRSSLITAGVAQLAESGWPGLTHRAVAARAGANPGLVHYYFKGSAGLRLAVAERVCAQMVGATVDALKEAPDEHALFDIINQAWSSVRGNEHDARLVSEVVSASFHDEDVGAVVRAEFARARSALGEWFGLRHLDWTRGQTRAAASLLLAVADGLTIHLLLDPTLATDDIGDALQAIGRLIDQDDMKEE